MGGVRASILAVALVAVAPWLGGASVARGHTIDALTVAAGGSIVTARNPGELAVC
jgi:hypothetical protein